MYAAVQVKIWQTVFLSTKFGDLRQVQNYFDFIGSNVDKYKRINAKQMLHLRTFLAVSVLVPAILNPMLSYPDTWSIIEGSGALGWGA